MRPSTRTALAFSLLGLGVTGWSGCKAEQQTQYVAGIQTQVQVPRDLKTIRVDVNAGGINLFCRAYPVYDGRVRLPQSLGAFPEDVQRAASSQPITITVAGFTERLDEANPSIGACSSVAPTVGKDGIRILRRSRQPYIPDVIAFLPMALKFGCFDTDCGPDDTKTCKAGRCYDANVEPSTLKAYSPELLDGTGGACFRASQCMAAAVPPVVVNPDDCTYAVPNTPSAPAVADGFPPNPLSSAGEGVNVEVVYDGGLGKEVLDQDALEGFLVPDPAKPQQFRLAPGLCDMMKGFGPDPQDPSKTRPTPHRISAVRASALCAAKSVTQPLCAVDQLAAMGASPDGKASNDDLSSTCESTLLDPAQSVLMIVSDDTQRHEKFYEDAELGKLFLSLSDPAFTKTSVGISYFPGGPDGCAIKPPARVPEPALLARDAIIQDLKGHTTLQPGVAEPKLAGTLAQTYQLLQAGTFASFSKRAVLVLGNRGFSASACAADSVALAAAARAAASPIETYVIMLTSDTDAAAPDPLPGAFALAAAGGSTEAFDGRGGNKARALDGFQRITKDLTTCVYDAGAQSVKDTDILSFADPIALPAKTVNVSYDAACTGENAAANGWGRDPGTPGRIRICGAACGSYRDALRTAQVYAGQYFQPAQAIPVFRHPQGCAPL